MGDTRKRDTQLGADIWLDFWVDHHAANIFLGALESVFLIGAEGKSTYHCINCPCKLPEAWTALASVDGLAGSVVDSCCFEADVGGLGGDLSFRNSWLAALSVKVSFVGLSLA